MTSDDVLAYCLFVERVIKKYNQSDWSGVCIIPASLRRAICMTRFQAFVVYSDRLYVPIMPHERLSVLFIGFAARSASGDEAEMTILVSFPPRQKRNFCFLLLPSTSLS